jgi:hypothetical protein
MSLFQHLRGGLQCKASLGCKVKLFYLRTQKQGPGVVVHACNPKYLGDRKKHKTLSEKQTTK